MDVKDWTRSHLPGERLRRGALRLCISLVLAPGTLVLAQGPPDAASAENNPLRAPVSTRVGVPLEDLLKEAEANNPQLRAAKQAWDAAKLAPSQVSVLPDPQFQLQHLSVGSPRPFAGFTNSDFAYVGIGVSQEIPYPGKLRLRGDIALREADVARENYEAVRRSVRADLKEAYLQLSYHVETLQTLQVNGQLLQRLEQAAQVRYRAGLGNQQELLRAQLEQTRLLTEVIQHDLETAKLQIRLKQILNRSPSFSDVTPATISETPVEASYYDLLAAARGQNPEIAATERMIEKQQLQVDLAHKDFYPDFSLQYMWQRTDPARFRAYYVLTFGMRIPIYQRRKQQPALAQAQTDLLRSRSEFDSQSLAVAAELGAQYATAQRSRDLLRIYTEGLLPQATALAESGLAAYQGNRLTFTEVLSASLEISRLNKEYWQILADHETAIARIEEITGLSLRSAQAPPAATP
jgi:cobalt-zinc-cadmium efflux system outer membrane protein